MQPLANFRIAVKEMRIKNNELADGEYQFSPVITRNIATIDEKTALVELILKAENSKEKPFPIDLYISLEGYFNIENIPKEQIDHFLKVQSVQILYPYLRASASNLTTAALMPPIVLPIIDAKTMFKDESK